MIPVSSSPTRRSALNARRPSDERRADLIRVVLAKTWLDAFRVLWMVTFGRVAAKRTEMMTYIRWPERRRLCRSFAEQCIDESNDEELAVAWLCLADDPAGPELYRRFGRCRRGGPDFA
jgi:hypothetical protein